MQRRRVAVKRKQWEAEEVDIDEAEHTMLAHGSPASIVLGQTGGVRLNQNALAQRRYRGAPLRRSTSACTERR